MDEKNYCAPLKDFSLDCQQLKNYWQQLSDVAPCVKNIRFYPNGWYSFKDEATCLLTVFDETGKTRFDNVFKFHVFKKDMSIAVQYAQGTISFFDIAGHEIGHFANIDIKQNFRFMEYGMFTFCLDNTIYLSPVQTPDQKIELGNSDKICQIFDSPDGVFAVFKSAACGISIEFYKGANKLNIAVKNPQDIVFFSTGSFAVRENYSEEKYDTVLFDRNFKRIASTNNSFRQLGSDFCNIGNRIFDMRDVSYFRRYQGEMLISANKNRIYEFTGVFQADGKELLFQSGINQELFNGKWLHILHQGKHLMFNMELNKEQHMAVIKKLIGELSGDRDLTENEFKYFTLLLAFLKGPTYGGRKNNILNQL